MIMHAVQRFWNIVTYFLFRFQYNKFMALGRINPILYFYKLPFAKRHFQRKGYDPFVELAKMWADPEGITSWFAFGYVFFLLLFVCIGSVNFFVCAVKPGRLNVNPLLYIPFCLLSTVTNHILLYSKDGYLRYFAEFEKMQEKWKRKWAWITFLTVLGILLFVIGSFLFGFTR